MHHALEGEGRVSDIVIQPLPFWQDTILPPAAVPRQQRSPPPSLHNRALGLFPEASHVAISSVVALCLSSPKSPTRSSRTWRLYCSRPVPCLSTVHRPLPRLTLVTRNRKSGSFGQSNGAFWQSAHSANYCVYSGNTPENHPPTEACMVNSKQHGVRNSGPWDP